MRRSFVRRTLFVIAAGSLLSGCSLPGTVSAPTPYPPGYLPTVIHLTAQAIGAATAAASSPTAAPTITATPPPATPVPTLTPTLGPAIPLAAIQIRAPGPMSRIVSPLQVQMLVQAGDSHRVEIDLFGEDGRLLGRTLTAVVGSPLGDPLSLKIPFEIRAAGEKGYLQVTTTTLQGRQQSLVTVPILLLSSGVSQLNPPGNTIYERVALSDLPSGAEVSGGVLGIDGMLLPYSHQPFILELITAEGKSVGLRVLTVSGSDWQPFKTTIPYSVTGPTPARLYAHQADDVLNSQAYVFSQAIRLLP